MISKFNEKANEEILAGWEQLLGKPPEPRKPSDLTAQQISDLWMIDRAEVYRMVEEGILEQIKVFEDSNGKKRSLTVYRIKDDQDMG